MVNVVTNLFSKHENSLLYPPETFHVLFFGCYHLNILDKKTAWLESQVNLIALRSGIGLLGQNKGDPDVPGHFPIHKHVFIEFIYISMTEYYSFVAWPPLQSGR
jgi:hypothetical protein